MDTYEYGVYNSYVRDAVRQGNNRPFGLSEEWENVLYFTVPASTPELAKKKAEARHSPVTGYVIECINKL
jgi:hypothetical protein|tara:strand:+ start:109 stop:318 length:210 start_codon:yes stop_codon:yes gene_type:complete